MNKNTPKCPNCQKTSGSEFLFSRNKFEIFKCSECNNSYTHPVPQDLSPYYHTKYWVSKGMLGKIKNQVFRIFQKRRIKWLKKYAKKGSAVLEIGAGEGEFLHDVSTSYRITGLELPEAKIRNPEILKADLLSWTTSKRFKTVIFWESIEHVPSPQMYLHKACDLLDKGGHVLIELPRFNSIEARLFKNHWFHLDPPRHLAHITDNGIEILAKRTGFKILERKSVLAPEYSVWGLASSIGDIFGLKETENLKKKGSSVLFLAYVPLLLLSLIIQPFFFFFDQSPIGFVVLRKV